MPAGVVRPRRIDAHRCDGLDRIAQLADRRAAARPWDGRPLACPRCRLALRVQHDLTRYGRFALHSCPAGHGSVQSLAALLARRGLVRPPTPAERVAMRSEPGAWACLNCGAPAAADADGCTHCGTPALLIDLPRQAGSLRPQAATRDPVDAGQRAVWACHACGHALDPTRQPACPQCGHLVMVPAIADLLPLLDALARDGAAPD